MKSAIAATAATVLLGALPAGAQVLPVDRVIAVARPANYVGPCPARIEFTGTIMVNRPTTVTYRWERSDRGMGQPQSVTIRSAGAGVATSWQLGSPGRGTFNGYQTLHVLSPNEAFSNPAHFSVTCR